MTRYISDQNKVVLLNESGLYSSTSGNGVWIGEVIDNSIDDMENKIESRFLGALTRSFVTMVPGPRDVKGVIAYYPQDMRIPFWAIGSVVDTSGTNNFHLATQIQTNVMQSSFTSGVNGLSAPISWTFEDSKTSPGTGRNLIRTVNGCVVDNLRLIATKSQKVKVEVDYIGQTLIASSGTSTVVTQSTVTPYLWNNCSLTIAGSVIDTTNEATLEIKQNIVGPHYLNGSRDISVPFPKNRSNTFDIKLDLDGVDADMLYNSLYKQNATFNLTFDMNADSTAGSQHTIIFGSGAKIISMANPSVIEGPVESEVKIEIPILIGSCFDTISKYNPW